MKIIVNQNATEQKLIETAKKVVQLAKQKASEGISSFYFEKVEGVHSFHLINQVLRLTDGSVDCAYRGLGKYHILFEIKS